MTDTTDVAAELRDIRTRLERLVENADSPALAAVLRHLAEVALDAQGYVDPFGMPLTPGHYLAPTETGGDHPA